MAKSEALRGLRSGWCFFAPVPRLSRGNRRENCTTTFNWLWADIDRHPDVDPDDILQAISSKLHPLGLWPTAIVFSGNQGIHAYWMLSEDLAIERVEASNKALSLLLDGDSCHDRTHILRHPGTINEKSGRAAALIELGGQTIPTTTLDQLDPVSEQARLAKLPSVTSSPTAPEDEEWLLAAEGLSGWGEIELDLRWLADWEKQYMVDRPRKGWRLHDSACPRGGACNPACRCRSDVEYWITLRLVGKQAGASDRQVISLADDYFAKHREELRKQGYRYIERTLRNTRRRLYACGWITSPKGGWPKRRGARFRWATVDTLEAELDLVRGQLLSEWINEVTAFGRSRSTAYRDKDGLERSGLVKVDNGRIYQVSGL